MQAGDVVQVKSGGPILTVLKMDADGNVHCVFWNEKDHSFETKAFNPHVLEVLRR